MDDPTYSARIFLRTFLARYPQRLSLGALTGVVVHVIVAILNPVIIEKTSIDLTRLSMPECIFVGIFLFMLPTIFTRYRLGDDLEHAIQAIRRIAQEGSLSRVQIQLLYLELARQELDRRQVPPPPVGENQEIL